MRFKGILKRFKRLSSFASITPLKNGEVRFVVVARVSEG